MTRQRSSKSQNIFEWPPSRTVKNMPSKGLTAPRSATALQRKRRSNSVAATALQHRFEILAESIADSLITHELISLRSPAQRRDVQREIRTCNKPSTN